ncbi:MAG: Lar family restriction alleviation protein, partial [Comamonas sp.]
MTTAQDQQSRELLPCPFCGREAMMSHSRDGEVCNVRCAGWSVGNCLGAGPTCYTEADAVAGWNRRAPAVQAARALPAGMEPLCYL